MGIFDTEVELFTTYRSTIRFRDRLMGGTPMSPKIIQAWLRTKAGIDKADELRAATARTLLELGLELPEQATYEEMEKASEALAGTQQTNGFKRDAEAGGLYIESRTIKAAIKECVNILYPYQAEGNKGKWGATKKAARSFTAERVFVNPDHIYLGRTEPDGVDLFIGHTSGPQGQRSNLTYHQYVERAEITFDIISAEDGIELEQWKRIWVLMQENGLGALRSQGFGRFDLERFERIDSSAKKPAAPRRLSAAS